jgi:arabinan endo-1,5-alpha-L-arabinosidase
VQDNLKGWWKMLRPIKKLFLSLLLVVFLASGASAALTHRYSFTNGGGTVAVDSVGGKNGALLNGAAISNNAVQLDGINDYVNLPTGLITGYTTLSFEAWFTCSSDNNIWTRVWDFGNKSGNNGCNYVFFTPKSGSGTFLYSISGNAIETTPTAAGVPVYVAITHNSSTGAVKLYVNGVLAQSGTLSTPLSSVNNVYNYLGRSLYSADSYLQGSIDEFRIYNSILTPEEIAANYNACVAIQQTGGSTEVTEGNSTPDTYTIALSSQPTANVNLTVDPDEQLDIGAGRGNSVVLLFTSSNWSTPQTVTVWAYDDNVLETDPHIGAICHYVSSSDTNFNNIPLPAVSVTVWENECGAWGFYYSDLNYNCQVNFKDVAILASYWLSQFDNDNLEILASEWLKTTQPYAANAQPGPLGDGGYERLTGNYYSHDPVMTRQGDTYYSFCSSVKTEIRTSTDMHNWQLLGYVWPSGPPAWTWTIPGFDGTIWAPDISYFNGEYHLYYAISSSGSRNSCIGLATRTTLGAGGWTDRGQVICTTTAVNNYNAIDPALFIDTNSTPTTYWLAFGSFWTGIKMRQIDPDTGLLLASNPTLYSIAARPNPPNANAIEASFIIYKEPYYYLFVSFDYCCQGTSSNYNVRVGRATSVTGPYYDRNGTSMMNGGGTQLTWDSPQWRAPGHNAVFLDNDGRYWLVHHALRTSDLWAGLRIHRLFWTADGWPTLLP